MRSADLLARDEVEGEMTICEGLNLQTLGTLINVDLPWNPSRLEQRLGRIFEMRYQATIDPDKDRWELCSRVLSRRDVVDRLSMPW